MWSVDTQTVRVTDTLAWLFDKLSLPNIGPHDIALAAIKDPKHSIAWPRHIHQRLTFAD